MNSQEYEESLNHVTNKVNLNYQMARVTIKENLSQFMQSGTQNMSQKYASEQVPTSKVLSQQPPNQACETHLVNTISTNQITQKGAISTT